MLVGRPSTLRFHGIEQMEALMGKLPSRAGWVSKRIGAESNDDMSGPLLGIVRRNAGIWKPESRRIVRRPVDVNAYQRKRTVSRPKAMLDVCQEKAGIFHECHWAMAAILPKLGREQGIDGAHGLSPNPSRARLASMAASSRWASACCCRHCAARWAILSSKGTPSSGALPVRPFGSPCLPSHWCFPVFKAILAVEICSGDRSS